MDGPRVRGGLSAHRELCRIPQEYRGAGMSNVIELSALRAARIPKRDLRSENDELMDPRGAGRPCRRGGRNMHSFVFRSYNLILQSDESDLMRDVCFDIDKAQTKLARIRRQMQHDR